MGRRGVAGIWAGLGLAGALLAGAGAAAAEGGGKADPQPVAGEPQPGAKAPDSAREREAQVDRLIAEYRRPPDPPEPSAEGRAEIEKAVKGLGAESFDAREAASAAAVKLGRTALAAMRKAAASADPEVAERAAKAVENIESAARQAVVARIREVRDSGEILDRKIEEARRCWAELALAIPAAERDEKPAEAAKLRADMAVLDELIATLKAVREAPAAPAAAKGGGN